MSHGLNVKMNCKVRSDELLEDTKLVLVRLLDLDMNDCPDLSIRRRQNGREEKLGSKPVLLEGASFLIGLPGTDALTELVLYEVEALRGVPESESGSQGSFCVSSASPALSFALAASAAIAFARRQKAIIRDWAAVWIYSRKNEYTVDDFIDGLATQGWFVDLKKEAKGLF